MDPTIPIPKPGPKDQNERTRTLFRIGTGLRLLCAALKAHVNKCRTTREELRRRMVSGRKLLRRSTGARIGVRTVLRIGRISYVSVDLVRRGTGAENWSIALLGSNETLRGSVQWRVVQKRVVARCVVIKLHRGRGTVSYGLSGVV